MSISEQLWRTVDGMRWFIVPDDALRAPGQLTLRSVAGEEIGVDMQWAGRYEVSESEGRRWAQEELGLALDELRRRIDEKLGAGRRALDEVRHSPVSPESALTPDAVSALAALARSLPGAIARGLSGDPARVRDASGEMAALEQRLKAAGVDLETKLAGFPERLADLRADFARARRRSPPDEG